MVSTAATYNTARLLRIAPDGGDTPSTEQLSDTQSSIEGQA